MSASVVGGPLCGRRAVEGGGAFRWFSAKGDTDTRTHADPGEGRVLYRWINREWRFAGHGAYRCDGCRSIIVAAVGTGRRVEPCPFCGAAWDPEVRSVQG